ncbi:MAG: hypothetical protein WCC30_08110 [Candidatus Dormiibacterota bacterium]
MNAAIDGGLARFWQPIEAAAESLATASPQAMRAVLTNLVDLLVGDLIPRLRAEEKVLLPLVSTELESGGSIGLQCANVSRLTESISTFAGRPPVSDIGRIHRTASALLALLAGQRQAEATLVARIRTLPAADRSAGALSDRLEEEAQASRASQFFVSEADRLPTEAWVLRHNPKAAQIGRVAPGRTSPVADLVAVLKSAL